MDSGLRSALATAVRGCGETDVMYNGSPQGCRNGGRSEGLKPDPCAVLGCADCGRRLMWSHLLHAYCTSDTVAQTEDTEGRRVAALAEFFTFSTNASRGSDCTVRASE